MAKDTVFPDDKLGWKPHPDSRSVLEEFRHVTIGLELTSASCAARSSTAPVRRAPESRRGQAKDARLGGQRDGSRDRRLVSARGKVAQRRCSSAGSITRPSITASSSPTTAPSASSRRSAASPRRSKRSLRDLAQPLVLRWSSHWRRFRAHRLRPESARQRLRLSNADASPCQCHSRRQYQSRRSPSNAIGFS